MLDCAYRLTGFTNNLRIATGTKKNQSSGFSESGLFNFRNAQVSATMSANIAIAIPICSKNGELRTSIAINDAPERDNKIINIAEYDLIFN